MTEVSPQAEAPITDPPLDFVDSPSGMGRGRLVVVNAAIGLLLIGSAFDIVTGREHWPFSPYAMFSDVERATTSTQIRLVGVTESGVEVALTDLGQIAPFGTARLSIALRRLANRPDGDRRLQEAAVDALRRYERRRKLNHHEGPALCALRIVEWTYRLEPRAGNRERPERRRLAEVVISEALPPPEPNR